MRKLQRLRDQFSGRHAAPQPQARLPNTSLNPTVTPQSASSRQRRQGPHSGSQSRDLCTCCNAEKSTYDTSYWDGTLEDLQSAASNGCLRCSFLASCIASYESDLFRRGNRFRAWHNFSLCELSINRDGKHDSLVLDIFALHKQNSTPWKDISVKRLLPGDTSSDATATTIASWMQECKDDHEDCNPSSSHLKGASYSPKRLLDLTGEMVVLREDVPDKPVYACLSHCWGRSTDILKTTSRNIDVFRSGVPWNNLTKTFQDAITVCRCLKINFLWIDSLCIIQGDEVDWDEQAPQMASIYKSASLTIAATKSKDSSGGCYRTTGTEHLAECVPGTDIYVRRRPPKFPTHWVERTPEEWPLLHRGWIYQEMRLSRRVLHFCSQEVMWECQNARQSESGCSDKPLGRRDPQRYMHTMYEGTPYSKLAEDPRKLWYKTVSEYSRLQLTFEKDKMPALAALTQDMETLRRDDRFLAGLWQKTLLFDLLWMVWPSPETGRLETWRAPTWSWACIPSQVMWSSSVDGVLSSVQIENIHYVSTGPARMGDIQEASISLRIPLLKARIKDRELLLDSTVPDYVAIHDKKWDYDFSVRGKSRISSSTDVFVAPIGIDKINHNHASLVLRKTRDKGVYERVGYAEIQHQAIVEEWRTSVARSFDMSSEDQERYMGVVHAFLMGLPVSSIAIV